MQTLQVPSLGKSGSRVHARPALTPITVGALKVDAKSQKAVAAVLQSNRLSPGPKVALFEEKFAELHDCRHGVMTNSGTDALRIALASLKEIYGWKDGDVVLCPSVTFVATVNVVLQCGLKPELVDVGMYDFNLNPDNLERRLSTTPDRSRIKGLIVVHLAGQPARMGAIMDVARKYGLKVIEDSCETMGVFSGHRSVGSWGDVGCFSFYVAHLLTTGVGGMAVTNDDSLSALMRSYANHGRDIQFIPGIPVPKLSKAVLQARFRFPRLGYSCRPTEVEAALGLMQLGDLPTLIAKRRKNAFRLIDALKDLPLVLPVERERGEHAYMFFPIVIPERSPISKWDLCLYLEKNGIETRELLPLTNQPCYRGLWNPENYSVAQWVNEKGFYVGCHQYLWHPEIDYMADVFHRFYRAS